MASLTWRVGWLCVGSSARVLCCGLKVFLCSLSFFGIFKVAFIPRGVFQEKKPQGQASPELLLAGVPLAKVSSMV